MSPVLLKKLNINDLAKDNFEKFKLKFPQLANMLLNPELLKEHASVNNEDSWQSICMNIMNLLWKMKGAAIFHRPVEPEKLGILNYFDIIKNPMDFGTIKQKLQYNVYDYVEEFIADVDLVFKNCLLYNGDNSPVGVIGIELNNEWNNLLEAYQIKDKY